MNDFIGMDYKKKNLTKKITLDREKTNNPPILKEITEFVSYSLPYAQAETNHYVMHISYFVQKCKKRQTQ